MPRLTFSDERIMIYDDFLPRDAFQALFEYANSDRYAVVHREAWRKVWRLGDGLPLHGTTTYFRDDAALYEADETSRYPTKTSLDPFIDAIAEVVADAELLVGKRGTQWTGMAVVPWVYPPGTGLSMHRDHYSYSGSYVFFVHREWNFHWGGQLLILDSRTGAAADPDDSPITPPFLSDEEENRVAEEPGLATCVLPKPNRLVFIAPRVYHMVTRVDTNAGNRPRVTLSGFFLLPKAAPADVSE